MERMTIEKCANLLNVIININIYNIIQNKGGTKTGPEEQKGAGVETKIAYFLFSRLFCNTFFFNEIFKNFFLRS